MDRAHVEREGERDVRRAGQVRLKLGDQRVGVEIILFGEDRDHVRHVGGGVRAFVRRHAEILTDCPHTRKERAQGQSRSFVVVGGLLLGLLPPIFGVRPAAVVRGGENRVEEVTAPALAEVFGHGQILSEPEKLGKADHPGPRGGEGVHDAEPDQLVHVVDRQGAHEDDGDDQRDGRGNERDGEAVGAVGVRRHGMTLSAEPAKPKEIEQDLSGKLVRLALQPCLADQGN
jgi:hypothetical protein